MLEQLILILNLATVTGPGRMIVVGGSTRTGARKLVVSATMIVGALTVLGGIMDSTIAGKGKIKGNHLRAVVAHTIALLTRLIKSKSNMLLLFSQL